jgi:YcxB-like protein
MRVPGKIAAVELRFTCDYRGSEAAASRRILNRVIYRHTGRWAPHGAILVPAALYLGFAFYTNWTAWLGTYSLPAIIGMGILVLIYIRFAAPRLNQRDFARATGVLDLEGREVSYEFDEEGYRIHTEHFEGFQKWAGVDRIIEEGGMILIVLGPNANFLPKRLFSSAAERRDFVAWAVSHLSPAARRRSIVR